MTDANTEADWACYREAKRLAAGAEYADSEWVALKAAALARTGWTPPVDVVVDPDVLRVRGLLHTHWLEEYGLSIAESLSAGHFDNDDDFIPALACYRAGLADGGAV
jgi:hypothetical protein